MPSSAASVYSVGSQVLVDGQRNYGKDDSEEGVAWVREVAADGKTLLVEWCVRGSGGTGTRKERVAVERVHASVMATPDRKRTPTADAEAIDRSSSLRAGGRATKKPRTENTEAVLASLSWRPSGAQSKGTPHPLADIYRRGAGRDDGWRRFQMRRVLDLGSGDLPRELEQQELVVYGIEVCTLGGLPPDAAGTRAISLAAINRAWGMSERYHSEAVAKLYQNGSSARKERSDCGRSIFTDHEFARRRITAYSEWRRELTQDGGVGATAVDSSALREEFESTDAVTRQEYEYKAEQRRLRVPHARQEAIEVMKRTNGLLSWDALADELGGYCCGETCRVRTRSCCGS